MSRNRVLNKKLPSSVGIVGLVVALVTIAWLSGNALLFGTKAANGNIPRDVQISNISDTSFTVSYTTDEFAIGTVAYGTDIKLGKVGLDDRDQQGGSPVSHRVHHITLNRLTPSTKYFFTITSGDRNFSDKNAPYSTTTAPPSTEAPTTQAPATGSVGLEDGTIPTEGLVYLTSSDSQLLSALLKPDGGYIIPLNTIRKKNLSSFLTFDPDSILHMSITNAQALSQLEILAAQTNPIPRVILTKDYNFTANDSVIQAAADVPNASDSAGFPTPSVDVSEVTSPEIISPQNNEKFQDPQPEFNGKAIANANIDITIESEQQPDQQVTASIQADANGNWQYRPSVPLAPGTHTISISSPDTTGAIQTVTNTFTVNASGSQFTQPSVSPTIGSIPTVEPTPVTLPSPTATASATPTIETPTVAPTIVATSGVPTQPPIPPTGSETIFVGVFAVLVSIGIGTLFFFFI